MTEDVTELRECRQCAKWLPARQYKETKSGGLARTCRDCTNQRAREAYRRKQEAAGKNLRKIAPEDRGGRRMCRDCETWLPLEDFSPTKHQRSGRASYCRPCMNQRNRAAAAAKAAEEGREIRAIRPRGPEDREGYRMCRDCEVWQPLAAFAPSSTRESGRGSYCQPCMNERTKTSYAKRIFERFGREVRKPEDLPAGLKRCARCQVVKEHGEFVQATTTVTGTHSYCKPCFNAAALASVVKHHGSTRDKHLMDRYGLTSVDVESMLAGQYGVCAICRLEHERYHVDHDHVTGKVRGILCFKCNNALGLFEEDYDRMTAAIEYLAQHNDIDEDAHYVPAGQRDPKGTWERARAEMEANREHHVQRLHSIFGVPAQRAQGSDGRVTGRGSP